MKSILLNVLVIIAAAVGVILLLKKGGDAGISKVKEVTALPGIEAGDAAPIRPQTIEGHIDNFKEAIALKPIRSWGPALKYGIMLAVTGNPKLNQPGARVVLIQQTAAPIVLEIQYTVAKNMLEMIEANPGAKNKFDGVALQVSTEGAGYKSFALLELEPRRRADHRNWLSYDLTLPRATKEIRFCIIGIPPRYNVFWDNCVISLPQLRVPPKSVSATATP